MGMVCRFRTYGVSTDGSTKSSQDTVTREWSQQSPDDDIEKLKAELVVLSRQADMSELEILLNFLEAQSPSIRRWRWSCVETVCKGAGFLGLLHDDLICNKALYVYVVSGEELKMYN